MRIKNYSLTFYYLICLEWSATVLKYRRELFFVHVFFFKGIDEDSKLNLSREQLETMLCFILKEAALFCRDINMDSTAPPPSQQV